MTYPDGGGIHKGDAGAVALALLQVGCQWDDHRKSQFNEPVAADQIGEFGSAVNQDIPGVIGFEGAVAGLVKVNENRYISLGDNRVARTLRPLSRASVTRRQ